MTTIHNRNLLYTATVTLLPLIAQKFQARKMKISLFLANFSTCSILPPQLFDKMRKKNSWNLISFFDYSSPFLLS